LRAIISFLLNVSPGDAAAPSCPVPSRVERDMKQAQARQVIANQIAGK